MLVAGCTSSGHGNGTAPLATSSTTSRPSTTPRPTTTVVPRVVNRTVWFGGFKVTITTAALYPTPDVRIDSLVFNEGENAAPVDAEIDLASGAAHYRSHSESVPSVPGKADAQVTLDFPVGPQFSLDDAVMTFGRPTEVQAIVPLGQLGQLVDLQPRPVVASGKLTINGLTVTVGAAELRADIPMLHRQVAIGQRELLVTADAALAGGDTTTVDAKSLRLRRPDGMLVAPDAIPTLALAPGSPAVGFTAAFAVPEAAAGKYQLVLESRPGTGTSSASVGFTVDATP